MTHQVYIDQILELVVNGWVLRGDDFVLEEDGDSGHGRVPTTRTNNPVAHWKKKYGLETLF